MGLSIKQTITGYSQMPESRGKRACISCWWFYCSSLDLALVSIGSLVSLQYNSEAAEQKI